MVFSYWIWKYLFELRCICSEFRAPNSPLFATAVAIAERHQQGRPIQEVSGRFWQVSPIFRASDPLCRRMQKWGHAIVLGYMTVSPPITPVGAGISMSRRRLRQIAATQNKPVHTKPGRRHEKASWLHQEIPVVYMALGWAKGKLGLTAGTAANSPQTTC